MEMHWFDKFHHQKINSFSGQNQINSVLEWKHHPLLLRPSISQPPQPPQSQRPSVLLLKSRPQCLCEVFLHVDGEPYLDKIIKLNHKKTWPLVETYLPSYQYLLLFSCMSMSHMPAPREDQLLRTSLAWSKDLSWRSPQRPLMKRTWGKPG